ncbi:hypothetical protein [Cupriavidus metallidurans]|uniref:hypothetical protein n=1 Tax=Cupriavidus metallidurans TaxID=119219 RepID=UPI001CCE74EA|nr:hypothetical protein LAI70_20505 [Cupriavidus metallidurans]
MFPTLNNTRKGSSAVFGKWYRLRLNEVGIKDDLKTFHSFRHTFRSELASLHIGQETTDAIMGHAPTGSTGAHVYTHIKLQGMAEAMGKVRYPIELRRVYRRDEHDAANLHRLLKPTERARGTLGGPDGRLLHPYQLRHAR